VFQESQPGWTVGSWFRPVIFGEYAPHQIFLNLNIEYQGDLVGDALVTEAGIPSFHLYDC
jgi:hypothetical protein